MRSVKANIIINAPTRRVWELLMDTSNYTTWNPFIRSVDGKLRVGSTIKLSVSMPEQRDMTFDTIICERDEHHAIAWKGKLLFKGLFDTHHRFTLTPIDEYHCKFEQVETFTGILVPVMWKSLEAGANTMFNRMNLALKAQLESSVQTEIAEEFDPVFS